MPITDNRPEWLREYDGYGKTAARNPPVCPEHGPRPVAAGLPDHPGFSGWGKVQTLDGTWMPCLRCGDCGAVLLVEG
jgi:hypothetical protein